MTPEVVLADDLRPVIERAIEEHRASHPQVHDSYRRNGYKGTIAEYGAFNWLEEESGINSRSIYRVLYRNTHVSLRIADALLTAIGRPYLLSNGEIPIIPNPRWSQERWMQYMDERGCRR